MRFELTIRSEICHDTYRLAQNKANYLLLLSNRNAAQPYAKAEGCIYEDPSRADGLRKGWPFRDGTWNVDSLTVRSRELVQALGERRIDIACAGNSVER